MHPIKKKLPDHLHIEFFYPVKFCLCLRYITIHIHTHTYHILDILTFISQLPCRASQTSNEQVRLPSR